MLASLIVLFASVAFVVQAGIAIAALRVLLDPKTSNAMRLLALKMVTFEQRFFALIFLLGLFGLAAKAGILPSMPVPSFWGASPAGQITEQPARVPHTSPRSRYGASERMPSEAADEIAQNFDP